MASQHRHGVSDARQVFRDVLVASFRTFSVIEGETFGCDRDRHRLRSRSPVFSPALTAGIAIPAFSTRPVRPSSLHDTPLILLLRKALGSQDRQNHRHPEQDGNGVPGKFTEGTVGSRSQPNAGVGQGQAKDDRF